MRVAAIQLTSSKLPEKNLSSVSGLIGEAVSGGACAVFLPENFLALGADSPRLIGEDEANTGAAHRLLAGLANAHGIDIFAGTMPLVKRPDASDVPMPRVRAASLVFDSNGEVVARYDKIHMFDVEVADKQHRYRESDGFEAGDSVQVIESPIGKVGLTVCYDIRFPEVYRKLWRMGAEIIAIPSAFTVPTGRDHFEILVRARAIENFSYVVAACQGGKHDSGRETWGHSIIVSPWGDVIAEAPGAGEAVIYGDLDMEELRSIRARMPTHIQAKLV